MAIHNINNVISTFGVILSTAGVLSEMVVRPFLRYDYAIVPLQK